MRIYRVDYDSEGEHKGYEFFGSYKEAFSAARRFYDGDDGKSHMDFIDFQPSKKATLFLLNRYAAHPDNG